MADYTAITSTRTTQPDPAALLTTLRQSWPDIGVQYIDVQHYVLKKTIAWTTADISVAQIAIDSAPALTLQRAAQNTIDNWPIEVRALFGAVLDQINTLRAALPTPLPPIPPAQALTAVRNKAATLS